MTAPRLMLISPELAAGTVLPLEAALGADSGIAAVILRTAPDTDERALLKTLKPLVEAAQAKDAAALIAGAPDVAGKAGADGVHVFGDRQSREAVARFKPEKIVGTGGLRTRDAAMIAGELGCDYVLFGDPGKGGETPPLEATCERLSWWAEIFTTPCAGQAETLDAIGPLARTGAEFIALSSFVWTHPDGPEAAMRAAEAALKQAIVPA